MDRKLQQMNTRYFEQFTGRTLVETDVLGFLSLAAGQSGSPVLCALHELTAGRDTQSGTVADYFKNAADIVSRLGSGGPKEKIELLFTFKDVRNALNQYFTEAGCGKLSAEPVSDFLLLVISLLQHVPFRQGKNRRIAGSLFFGASEKELLLLCSVKTIVNGRSIPVTFPVIAVKNEYEPVKRQDAADSPYLFEDSAAEVIRHDGKLLITFPEA
ncbi:hypothetical protein NCCP2716_12330 [Sporosarcina sp. NCCP-2716]|uniref:hypothetical protein n=1 Tax=Sporosarcina sp. NCCP-2716 TaxID=2943679 RepID=UPI00203C251B|nr:hypothetical protein [Sporosarcina sp. NCCP-2716]GKV68735.1 hypothetical protein NCCP2716_12330 [Sporosarcina sp. NCCP-2716]